MIGAATLALLLALACAQQDVDAAATIAAWREALELDLPAEVLGPGPALVAEGAPLSSAGEAVALVARALSDAGRDGEARALLDGAQVSEASVAHVELERARRWLEQDELERVIEHLRRSAPDGGASARFPERAACWTLLGRALARAGRPDEAAPCLVRAVELEPFGEAAYSALHMLSQFALRRGDGAEAQALVDRAQRVGQWRAYYRVRRLQVREQPDEPLPRLGLAQLWMQIGRLEHAREVLDELLARAPEFAAGWFHLGEVLRAGEDLAGAKAAYTRALELDAELLLARYNRAVIALVEGDVPAARADFERLVDGPHAEDPRALPAHLGLARILHSMGERDAAAARYARYRKLGGSEALVAPVGGR